MLKAMPDIRRIMPVWMDLRIGCMIALLAVAMRAGAQEGQLFTSDYQLSSSLVNQITQDSKGFVWMATSNGLDRYDSNTFTEFRKTGAAGSILSNNVGCVVEDASGRILVGHNRGLQIYDFETSAFTSVVVVNNGDTITNYSVSTCQPLPNGGVLFSMPGFGLFILEKGQATARRFLLFDGDETIDQIYRASDGMIWFAATGNAIFRWDGKRVRSYMADEASRLGRCCLAADKEGRVFCGSVVGGLFMYDPDKARFRSVDAAARMSITSLCALDDGRMMVGSNGEGAFIYDCEGDVLEPCKYYHPQVDLSLGKISSILEDRDGNIWLALFQKGVFLQPGSAKRFEYIGYRSGDRNVIGSCCVMSLSVDRQGNIYVGTDGEGLYAISGDGDAKRHYPAMRRGGGALFPATITGTLEDTEGDFWIASYLDGAGTLDRSTGKYHRLPFTTRGMAVHVFDLEEDADGNIWIATMGDGLKKYDKKSGKVTRYDADTQGRGFHIDMLPNAWVADILLSGDKKRLYICMSSGLSCLDMETNSFLTVFGKNHVLDSHSVNYVAEDDKGQLWACTGDGLYVLDLKGNILSHYTIDDGLADDHLAAIAFDRRGNAWISTFHGMSMLDVERGEIFNYYSNDGLQGSEFSERAVCMIGDTIVFGGNNGLTYFMPENIDNVGARPQIFLVDFLMGSTPVTTTTRSGWGIVTRKIPMESDAFSLSNENNSFTVRFSAMEYACPEGVVYKYSVNDGVWETMQGAKGVLTMNHMRPGNYDFRVKAVINGIESDERHFRVVVRQPWYATIWAYLIYICVAAFALWYYLRMRRQREMARLRLQDQIHQKQLGEAKLQFFMNINHEIRTPMTLIMGPLQNLLDTDDDPARQQAYQLISRNAERILALINQILDMRKIDMGQMTLKMTPVNIVDFVKDVYNLFDGKSRETGIVLRLESDADNIEVWIDRMNFDKVIMNLLSNAFKFTPKGGNVAVRISHDDRQVHIEVWDDGMTIAEDSIGKIFQRFYREDNQINNNVSGTGIGLNLTQNLVELHHGTITVHNNPDGKGCAFVVTLPLGNAHLRPEEMMIGDTNNNVAADKAAPLPATTGSQEDTKKRKMSTTKKTIVVAEDEDDIRNYLVQQLSTSFNVVACRDGKEALSETLRLVPSLVLSDVMMPEMDGYTLCAKIKTNINVNAVPVVLLTARIQDKDKLTGLSTGADAYMEKPFNVEVLRQTIHNLISAHDTLTNKMSGKESPQEFIDDIIAKTPDERLLERVSTIINDHISDPRLSVEFIASEVGISRAHLHRKLKAMTNQSPREFLRNTRLRQAANLLASGHYDITQVADACGFTNPASFSSTFKDFYGCSPKEYMYQHQKENKDENNS